MINSNDIFNFIERYTRIPKKVIQGRRRDGAIVKARFQFIWLCKNELNLTTTEIGRLIHRDHATIIYALRAIKDLMSVYKEIHEDYDILYNTFCVAMYQFSKINNMKYFTIQIQISENSAVRILGGLAIAYKQADKKEKEDYKASIEDILKELQKLNVNILANPFKTYVELINFEIKCIN